MHVAFGLLILIGCLLIGVYLMADYLIPSVFCKIIPRGNIKSHMEQQYNSHVFSDICSGIHAWLGFCFNSVISFNILEVISKIQAWNILKPDFSRSVHAERLNPLDAATHYWTLHISCLFFVPSSIDFHLCVLFLLYC